MHAKHRTHLFDAERLELARVSLLLDLAKALVHATAGVQRLGVALVAGGVAIDGGASRV